MGRLQHGDLSGHPVYLRGDLCGPTGGGVPYQTSFSLEHFAAVFTDSELITVYWHSLVMALLTAFLGTLAAYGAALITARSTLPPRYKRVIESIAW